MAVETDFLTARSWCAALLEAHGMDRAPAERTAWALTMAEVWGRPSHGLLRLPFYLERFDAGGTDPRAVLGEVRSTSVTAALDGGNGLGHWQVWEASRRAAQMATSHGIAAVSVANSGHCGVLGLYVLPLVDAGLIGLVFSTGPAVMAAPGGRRAVVSTSPIAAGIPTHPRPAIIDLATSAVARGRIAAHAASGEPLEEGWALDETGEPTTDAARALGGMLAPLGGAKGFALAFLVESMTGAMVGPLLATEIADPLAPAAASTPQRVSHVVVAFDPASFDGDGRSGERLDRLAASVSASGGRVPGSGHPLDGEVSDSHRLEIPERLATTLADLSRSRGVEVPHAFSSR